MDQVQAILIPDVFGFGRDVDVLMDMGMNPVLNPDNTLTDTRHRGVPVVPELVMP